MTRARLRALLVVCAALVSVAALAATFVRREPAPLLPRPPEHRSVLLRLTSLPLVFGEDFSLRDSGSPALAALETRYRVVPISVSDPADMAKRRRLLLLAHPLAHPAEDLVALVQWGRGGGRVLLLADPMLEWPSERPLGDPLRPSPMFADTGLLQHWGVRLGAPDQRGPAERSLG